ncbi:MAG: asparagine synthetase B, partial [Candidatus Omnitrophica bacterium]|nr:asparagine synthetase B [Candidatus Omnitrophota bacterium]
GRMKINQGITKYILKKAAEKILPHDLVHRPKEGFVLPVYSWMRTSMKDFVLSQLSQDKIRRTGILCPDYVGQLTRQFVNGDKIEAKIWSLLCFMIWWEVYFG